MYPKAEYLSSYNNKSDKFYMHHGWIKTNCFWASSDVTDIYYILLNSKLNKSVLYIKRNKTFTNIFLPEANRESNKLTEGMFLGLAFT